MKLENKDFYICQEGVGNMAAEWARHGRSMGLYKTQGTGVTHYDEEVQLAVAIASTETLRFLDVLTTGTLPVFSYGLWANKSVKELVLHDARYQDVEYEVVQLLDKRPDLFIRLVVLPVVGEEERKMIASTLRRFGPRAKIEFLSTESLLDPMDEPLPFKADDLSWTDDYTSEPDTPPTRRTLSLAPLSPNALRKRVVLSKKKRYFGLCVAKWCRNQAMRDKHGKVTHGLCLTHAAVGALGDLRARISSGEIKPRKH